MSDRSTFATLVAAASLASASTAAAAVVGAAGSPPPGPPPGLPAEVILVCDSDADEVRAFDPATGADLGVIVPDPGVVGGFDVLRRPIAAIDSGQNTILVSDQFADVVLEFGWDGSYLGIFSNSGVPDPDLLDNVRGIDLGADGSLLVANAGLGNDPTRNSIVTFDGGGVTLPSVVFQREGGIDGPFDVLRVDAGPFAGLLVSSEGSDTITRFDASGRLIGRIATGLDFPQQLDLTPGGNLLVAVFSAGQIVELAPDGTIVATYEPAGLSGYRGVCVLDDGRLLVTSSSGVHVLETDGSLAATVATGSEWRYAERVTVGGDALAPGAAPASDAAPAAAVTLPAPPVSVTMSVGARGPAAVAPSASASAMAGPARRTMILVLEDSGFFAAPGIEVGTIGRLDPADPTQVEIIGRIEDLAGGLNPAGVDQAPAGERIVFDTSTTALRRLGPAGTPATSGDLIDSVGFIDDLVGGLTLSLDGTVAYAVGNDSAFGRIVVADAATGVGIDRIDIVGRSFSGVATVPEGAGLPWPAGTLLAVENLDGGARLVAVDPATGTVTEGPFIGGLGFVQAFETGLDFAPDGTLYAMLQGFQAGGPDVPARLYELDAATGSTSLLGVIGGGGWDASSIAVVSVPAGVPGDVDGDGDVDFDDVLALLAAWGPCPDPPAMCPGDLSGDGEVGFADLLVVLAEFQG
ncbi:MAG: hypothetical protein AB8G96_15420 [Phycisphaerales bacterium]